jgi:hypothetical protein
MQSSGVSFLELIQPQSLFTDMAIGAYTARHGVWYGRNSTHEG